MTMPPPPPGGGYGSQPPPPGGPPYGGPPQQPYGAAPTPYGAAPPPGGPYGPPPGGGYGPPGGNDQAKTFGIVSLVLGIIGLPATCCCWFIGWIFPVGALITGLVGYSKAGENPSSEAKPFSIAGIVLGAVGLLVCLASFVWVIFYNGTSLYDY